MKGTLVILKDATKNLHPSYFAMVMGTGIVSIAFNGLGFTTIAYALFCINLFLYTVLSSMAFIRLVLFTQDFITDISAPRRSWPYLTFVVGNNTVGAQLLIFHDAVTLAWILWGIGTFFWAAFTYYILFNLVTRRDTDIRDTVDGATLLVTVSTASVALLGLRLGYTLSDYGTMFLFGAWCFWAASFLLYIFIITCILYRKLSRSFEPKDWHGPYWICMGAMAIVTLTGTDLVSQMAGDPIWSDFREPTIVLTGFAWAIGTWWIPYQIIMDIWKLTRFNIKEDAPLWVRLFPWARLAFGQEHHLYEPPEWARVFPMGMYTACTLGMANMTGFTFLEKIPGVWGWLALLIWALTFVGMLRSVLARFCLNKGSGS